MDNISGVIHLEQHIIGTNDICNDNMMVNTKQFYEFGFIMNALNSGWTVRKTNSEYILTKKTEGLRETFNLADFIAQTADIRHMFCNSDVNMDATDIDLNDN